MNILHAVILGIVEGITEFLPISSTGHLILAADILRVPDSEFLKTFEIMIQLGAILAVVFLYWRRVADNLALARKIAVAFLPTAVVGLLAYDFIKGRLLGSTEVVLWALFLGGVAIWAFEKWHARRTADDVPGRDFKSNLENMTYGQAAWIGLAQSLAVIPGVSRAAATIIGGLIAGLDRKSIVEFSFLLAIPTMVGATGLDLFQTGVAFSGQEYAVLAVGLGVSFVTAMLAVKWLVRYIQTHDFTAFGVYRIALAVVFWLALMA